MRKAWRDVPALRSWSLHNFKSVADAELDLAPLTLVVGANSAGKSSLLQSILMMAQAAAETTPGGFPLNGLLVGLGEFTEARSDFEGRTGENISIGGKLALPYPIGRRRPFAEPEFELDEDLEEGNESERPINAVAWVVNLKQDPESRGSALVHDSRVTLFRGSSKLGQLSAFPRSEDDFAPRMQPFHREEFGDRYKMTESFNRRLDIKAAPRSKAAAPTFTEYGAVQFSAGIPVNGLIAIDEVEWRLNRLRQMVEYFSDESGDEEKDAALFDVGVGTGAAPDAEEAANRLYLLLKDHLLRALSGRRPEGGAEIELEKEVANECNRLMSRPDYQESVRPVLLRKLLEEAPERRSILVPTSPVQMRQGGMRTYARDIPEYLKTSVLYLGPLREDPRVAYPHSIAGSTHMPLGRKGESTASVLLQSHASGRRPVMGGANRYPRPDGRSTSFLEGAVRDWVREFGLGNTLNIEDQARYGVGFTIDQRDLTSVGTGVSQILPVIVLCLMARPGQLVMLEQPELHLNPALQQKLADFFLAMVRSGRQLIVETHSEYIVTRLRLRVVEDEKDEVRNLFNIVFAEQNGKGRTNFQVFDVDPSGALGIKQWPTGFFDQAGSDVEAMMRLTLSRRRRDSADAEK
ncbi:hypothetical protein MSS4_03389 [Mycobacterium marinum]|uniref:AAA family ATPase n=1 Tax=Mycobacterium marinum TaxID=1781 RepID=UPI000E3D9D10|nr:AAA family ATPase [Mycobacterium marinum]RFZ47391.1 hypothetical protein MSS4_03389 [Mycobacterium marinum]